MFKRDKTAGIPKIGNGVFDVGYCFLHTECMYPATRTSKIW